ncbi:MAG: ribonuclease Z [Eubacteriales bacterium]|nr:ribonuclease Z [Eubacteriales bacterium]
MLELCLLGCGGMMPLPYRRLTSFMARYNGSSILIDCGEGTQIGIKHHGWSFKPIDVICFTHFHADHISGLPGLLLTLGNCDRTEPLLLVGPRGLERVVNSLRVIAPDLPFPIHFHELTEKEESIDMGDYRIEAFRVNHNVVCYGYALCIDRAGRFDVDRARANEIPMKYWSRLQKGETIETPEMTYTSDMVLGPARKGLKCVYTTDTRPTPLIAEYAKEADLFVCEGMYGDPAKKAKATENKHMMMSEAAQIAEKAQVKQLWLTHYSPSLAHPEEYLEETRKIFAGTELGKDGKSLVLQFEEE